MQIDWFTVVAQVLNFLVLVWLLKRFLYRPILAAIDAREQGIARTLEEASLARQQAAEERDLFAERNTRLEVSKAGILEATLEDARVQARQVLDKARAEADLLLKKQQEDQHRALQALRAELSTLVLAEVFAMTRKILRELADTTLEQGMVGEFIEQLQSMSDTARKPLLEALRTIPKGGLIRSAFELDTSLRQRLQEAIDTWADTSVPLQFDVDSTLVCGLELGAKGQHSAWNITQYLQDLDHAIRTRLAATGRAESPVVHV